MTTTTDKLARYEAAQGTLGMMIAMRSRWIRDEENKPCPDQNLIAKWKKEQNAFDTERDDLNFGDEVAIQRVFEVYSPIVRAEMGR